MLTSTQHTLSVWVENTGLPLGSLMQAEFTDGLAQAGLGAKFKLLGQAAVLADAYFKLPWWQKLAQQTRYRWRFECLWVISRAYKHTLETYGQDLPFGRWIDWQQFLDTLPPELVRQWARMSWWKRRTYARKTMTWLAYVQDLREAEINAEAARHEQNDPTHEQDTCKEDPLGL